MPKKKHRKSHNFRFCNEYYEILYNHTELHEWNVGSVICIQTYFSYKLTNIPLTVFLLSI